MDAGGKDIGARRRRSSIEVVEPAMAAVLRKKSPAERLQISTELWRYGVDLLLARLKQIHPDWTEEERSLEVARRMAHGSW